MAIGFEWDPEKADSNERKHGVSFDTALRVFADPFALSRLERIEDGEERWQTLGLVEGHLLLVVVHTVYDLDETTEILRIISARKADRTERRRYEQEAR